MGTFTRSTDSFQTSSDGLDFNGSDTGDTWTISPNIFVTSQTQTGVNSNGATNNTLINNGFIASLGSNQYGVELYNGTEIVINEAGAEIFSAATLAGRAAVFLNGTTGDHLDNLGIITGVRSGVDTAKMLLGLGHSISGLSSVNLQGYSMSRFLTEVDLLTLAR